MDFPAVRTTLFWLLCICFSLVLVTSTSAQDKDWRPVTPEELASKAPVVEPDADAEAIFWEVKIDASSESKLSSREIDCSFGQSKLDSVMRCG